MKSGYMQTSKPVQKIDFINGRLPNQDFNRFKFDSKNYTMRQADTFAILVLSNEADHHSSWPVEWISFGNRKKQKNSNLQQSSN